ncbi:MAG: aminopeptidase [Thermodesulfobacteriota bacterium]|nr:aminopeptidase [Thermodesulfobacteriota bacterium]
MFTAKQLDRYADVLLWGLSKARTKGFKKKDIILVRYDPAAVKLAEIIHNKLLAEGKNPVMRAGQTPGMEHSFYSLADDAQLAFQAPGDRELLKNLNGSISLIAPESLTHLRDIDPKKIGRAAAARKPLRDLLDARENKGEFGWTLCMFPTQEMASHAGLSVEAYAKQIIRACFLDRKDPVDQWMSVYKKAMTIKRWLNRMRINRLHVESRHTDIEINPGESRKWLGISGHNIPSFELFLSPDWRNTRGTYFADMPSYRNGNYIKNLKIEFQKGEAATITADEGQAFARKLLATDDGAPRIGEFSLTDKRFSKISRFMANTLFDENFGGRQGNCHIALGASYADTFAGDPAKLTKPLKRKLGFNDSAIHWDIINTEKKRVSAILPSGKKKTIYENGTFTL